MTTQATPNETISGIAIMYMSIELSDREWKVLLSAPSGRRLHRSVPARDAARLLAEIAKARAVLKLPEGTRVVSCYEAGRDGFWLHRVLELNGITNLVVDAASIEVPQRARRAKTDRLDLASLMSLLQRRIGGEVRALHVVHVPTVEAEDLRQLSRTIGRLKDECAEHVVRMKSLLIKQGIKLETVGGTGWAGKLAGLKGADGRALDRWLVHDLVMEGERLALARAQLTHLQARRDALVEKGATPVAACAKRLMRLCGVARESSFVFATEVLGWRKFANRRELAGAVGLVPTPFKSGRMDHEQGISKAGNRRMRTMMVEIAWCWLRYQPDSELSRWWQRRFEKGGARQRKVGIIAVARKLLVALWRYLEAGIMPAGAELKGQRRRGEARA